ncbi:PA-phosphatase [Mycolicibacterium hodleri]|uniref:PA-phosphatase n=1 Tax=Mycolicibacterium hodleri TaxID=49897 RepID=UPI0021F2CF11|nr:PA-phosphatase [Mycolicibacterium hodleri]
MKWWPAVGLPLMVALGLAVGNGSTRLDDWFIENGSDAHPRFGWLLLFTMPLLLVIMLGTAAAVALYRRHWRLAAVVVVTPLAGVVAVRLLKRLFGREREGALAYPSGHVTVLMTVLGMVVLVWGTRRWLLLAVTAFAVLGTAGQALTYHYFTDTIGAVLLGSSLVAAAAVAAKVDGCQPRCDLDHSSG